MRFEHCEHHQRKKIAHGKFIHTKTRSGMPARAKKKFIHNRKNSHLEGFGRVDKRSKVVSPLSKILDNQAFEPDFLYSLLVGILSNKMEFGRVSGVFRAVLSDSERAGVDISCQS
jgi:hypothetical protein